MLARGIGYKIQTQCFSVLRKVIPVTMGDSTNNESDLKLVDAADRAFLQKTHQILVDEALVKGSERSTKVVDFKTPKDIMSSMDLTITREGTSQDKMLELYIQTVANSTQTGHPRYCNQLYGGRNIEGVSASWLVEALNTNVHTFDSAPVFSVAERYVISEVCKKVGYEIGEGVFLPGGSMCNFMGIHLARFQHDKSVKEQGLVGQPRQMIFSTADAHYSVSKAAHFMGFGTDSVVFVESDDRGRMLPSDLRAKMEQCKLKDQVPVCTIATSGTTVLGSFDPLSELADVCQEYDCWLHVDACWGGGVLFSDKHKSLMDGIEKTNSVSISFHKLMGAQIQCAAVLIKDRDLLSECNSIKASYLFQPDRDYYEPSYDIGTLTVQCGRKADGYKFWALWKSRGHAGMRDLVDVAFDRARYFTEKLKETEGIIPVIPEFQGLNLSFWYVPPSMRDLERSPEWWQKLGKVAPTIRTRMLKAGTVAIGYQPLESKGFVNFFRMVIANSLITETDLDFILEDIDRHGRDL